MCSQDNQRTKGKNLLSKEDNQVIRTLPKGVNTERHTLIKNMDSHLVGSYYYFTLFWLTDTFLNIFKWQQTYEHVLIHFDTFGKTWGLLWKIAFFVKLWQLSNISYFLLLRGERGTLKVNGNYKGGPAYYLSYYLDHI